ncbi:MAG: hypothetical protein SPK28_01430 [Bacilli bacterium]|nr:hypothetical protein [Bacilli bacterium]
MKLVCVFYKEATIEQIKRKEFKESEVVCSYIDTDTGEVEYTLREGDSIRVDTREQKEYRANHKYIKKNNSFVKVYKDTIGILAKEDLTKSEFKIILTALAYLDKTSGILTLDGVNIGKQKFMELVDISHNTFTEGINHLIELNILARTKSDKNSVYLMNPFIFMNGTYTNATLYRIFKKSKWNTQND